MKLIIEIPEKTYNALTHTEFDANLVVNEMRKSIDNGTPISNNAIDVLDAIKLEIKQELDNQGDWSFNDGLIFALDIIDKYAPYQKGGK